MTWILSFIYALGFLLGIALVIAVIFCFAYLSVKLDEIKLDWKIGLSITIISIITVMTIGIHHNLYGG